MGFSDKLRNLAQKAENEAATHKDQVHKAVLKAEDAADQRTGGQYHDQIVRAGQKADEYVETLKEPESPPGRPADSPPGENPPAAGSIPDEG